jgi:diacylglycerol kinase family enzyme
VTGESGRAAHARARLLAWASLAAGALLAVGVLVALLRNGVYLVIALGGVCLAVAGGWWVITTDRPYRRAVGLVVAVAGVGLLAFGIIAAGDEDWASLVRLVLALVLLIATLGFARLAHRVLLERSMSMTFHRTRAPSHPVLLCNPWSGGGKVERFDLLGLASSSGVETVVLERGLNLEELARDAIRRGADCLGMAGGDGSQALVASLAVEHDLPFVCVSAGTRNHFALDLGLPRDDPRECIPAFRNALERRVDYATVNDRFFVNNVSLGVYATIVQQPGYRDAKVDTTKRLLPELLGKQEEPFDLRFTTPDGREVDGAFVVMVSNNPYVLGPSLDVSQRRRLDTGRLGVFAITAATGAQAAGVVTLALAGRGGASGQAYEFDCETFEVRSRSGKVFAGVDGEALELETPLKFRIHPEGLRMFVPEGNQKAALRRAAREVQLRDMVELVTGRETASQ